MTMGEKILNMRKARGWSQEDLAERIGVTRQAVSRWESNSAKPDADKIIDICDLFGVSSDYLLRDKYSVEGERFATVQTESAAVPRGVTAIQILGILMIISAILICSALGIMSAIDPHLYILDGFSYSGVLGYIMGNRLWWLIWADAVILICGVLLLVGKEPLNRFMRQCKVKMDQHYLVSRISVLIGASLLMMIGILLLSGML